MGTRFEVIHHCCAGLDVHQATIRARRRRISSPGAVGPEVRPSPTTTAGLRRLVAWLESQGVTIVAMESTGVYWEPVFNILEGRLPVLLVNAQHLKKVPGRKSDGIDRRWIAQLLRCGLLQASLVPPPAIRQSRDLRRRRTQLVRERASVVDRIQEILEDANIKLAGVASDILGVSGRAMLTAISRGTDDPAALADPARKSSRRRIPAPKEALDGLTDDHHRSLLRRALDPIEAPEGLIQDMTDRVEEVMAQEPRLSPAAVDDHPRDPRHGGRGDRGRDRGGYEPIPERGPSLLLGGDQPRQGAERQEAPAGEDHRGEPMAADHSGPGGLGGQPSQGDQVPAAVRPAVAAPRSQGGADRGGPPDPGVGLYLARARAGLRGA